jgi:hypothetical protein
MRSIAGSFGEYAIFLFQELLKIMGKGISQFLPSEQLEPAAKFEEPNGSNDFIPCFDEIGPTSIAEDTEGSARGICGKRATY